MGIIAHDFTPKEPEQPLTLKRAVVVVAQALLLMALIAGGLILAAALEP